MLPPVGIEPRPLIASDSKSNTILSGLSSHKFACKTETLGSLYSHTLFIIAKSSQFLKVQRSSGARTEVQRSPK